MPKLTSLHKLLFPVLILLLLLTQFKISLISSHHFLFFFLSLHILTLYPPFIFRVPTFLRFLLQNTGTRYNTKISRVVASIFLTKLEEDSEWNYEWQTTYPFVWQLTRNVKFNAPTVTSTRITLVWTKPYYWETNDKHLVLE